MSTRLPPNSIVCVTCHQCEREQFIITNAAGQPTTYDGPGFAPNDLSIEEGIERMFSPECNDCERIKSLDAPFIAEQYWVSQPFDTLGNSSSNKC